nr:MAG TPA: hypothetical protein [Bacteriophage sp.]
MRHYCKQVVYGSLIHSIRTNKVFIACKNLRIYLLYYLLYSFKQSLLASILYRFKLFYKLCITKLCYKFIHVI